MRRLVATGVLGALVACASLTAQDKAELAQYEGQQDSCIAAHAPDKAAIDACRAEVKKYWCGKWDQRFDAGVCP